MRHKAYLLLIAVVISGIVMSGCGPAATPKPPAVRPTLRVAHGNLMTSLQPNATIQIGLTSQKQAMFEMLIDYDLETKGLSGMLAESWSYPQPDILEFKLRKGVKFHNGEDFNAKSVKFTLETVLDPKAGYVLRGRFEPLLKQIQIVDDYTVRVQLKAPSPYLLLNLTEVWMLPPKYLAEVGEEGFIKHPVGTGPFKLVKHLPGEKMTVEAFDDYWKGPPKLAGIEFYAMAEATSRAAALEARELDVAFDIAPEDVDRLRGKGFEVAVHPTGIAMVVAFNEFEPGPVRDVRVRKALNYAVDTGTIIKKITNGLASPLNCQWGLETMIGYNPDLKPYPYDPEKAKKLLAEAGYPEGKGLKMHLLTTQGKYMRDKEATEAVADYWKAIGVDVDLEVAEVSVYYQKWNTSTYGPAYSVGWGIAPHMDAGRVWYLYRSDSKVQHFNNVKFNALDDQQKVEVDPKQRVKLLQEGLKVMCDEAIMVPLYMVPGVHGISPAVKNLGFGPDFRMVLDNIKVTR